MSGKTGSVCWDDLRAVSLQNGIVLYLQISKCMMPLTVQNLSSCPYRHSHFLEETTRVFFEPANMFTIAMEEIAVLYNNFVSAFSNNNEEVFEKANSVRQVQLLLNEGVFNLILLQVIPSYWKLRLKMLALPF